MADLRIADAPEIDESEVQGGLKIPTGGFGNKAINMNTVASWVVKDKDLVDKTYVDNAVGGGGQGLSAHIENKNNPHEVTKAQVGLGNVDNTADADKPISNATSAALNLKADKTATYTKTEVDGVVDDIYQSLEDNFVANGAALPYDPQVTYNDGAIVVDNGALKKVEGGTLVNAVTAESITVGDSTLDQIIPKIGAPYSDKYTYSIGDEVALENGDRVRSTIDNNTNNPNVDMTGWENTNQKLYDEIADLKQKKPLFIETLLSFGKYGIGAPTGVANYTGGNYVLTVSGSKGSNFVTVNSGNIDHAGATAKWAAVIEYADGSFGLYQVQGFAGSQLNIFPALDRSVSNVKLGNIHDMVAGQHYTELGYKAFAQHIYNFNAKYALRDKFIAQFYGTDTSSDWVTIGSPSLTYNRGLSPSGSDNLMKGDSNRSLTVKANAADEGVYWEVDLGKTQGYLELNAGLLEGTSATIEFYLDDILKETKIIGLTADRFIFEYANYSKGKILIKALTGTTVRIGRTVWWNNVGKSETLIPASATKIAYLGDSWGTYSNAANPNEILRMHKLVNPNATLVNKSQGGMTTKYAVAWIDWVLEQKPDVVIIEYFTNDNNCIIGVSGGINFKDPEDNTQNTFVTRADYFNNLAILANKCMDAGVQPIFVMPAVVESQLQTQYHAILARDIGTGSATVPQQLKLQSLKSTQVDAGHILVDTIETKTEFNTVLKFTTSVFGALFQPRVARFGDEILFQVKNKDASETSLFEVIADELIGNKMPSLNLTGIYAEQGLKLNKSQIVDSILSSYAGNVLRIRGKVAGDLKSIQIGENAAKVELLAPATPFVASSLPAAAQSLRGQVYLIQGGVGVADSLYICIKNASEGYEWKEL